MTFLDWSGRDGTRHWGGGVSRPCRTCQVSTLLLDDAGRPQHKACAEREADLDPATGPVPDPDAEVPPPNLEAEALG